jgi:hypothetical protein
VVPAEFETAVEIFFRVMVQYLLPQSDVEHSVADIRANGYKIFGLKAGHAYDSVSNIVPGWM